MKKEAEFAPVCARIVELDARVKKDSEELKKLKDALKKAMNAESLTDDVVGGYTVNLNHVAPSRIVDAAKLKEAGLFEKYSKEKAGYDTIVVTPVKTIEILASEPEVSNAAG